MILSNSFKKYLLEAIIVGIIAFGSSTIASFLYYKIIENITHVDWHISFVNAIILGSAIPLTRKKLKKN